MPPEEAKRRVFAILRRFRRERYLPLVVPEGMTPSEANVIVAIYALRKHGADTLQPRDLAKRLHLTPSALSQTLKVLEEKGYIVRSRMSDDSRAVSLGLTDHGFEVAEEADRMRDSHLNELVAYVGEDDMNHLMDTLEKILDFYKEQEVEGKVKKIPGECNAPPDGCGAPPGGFGASPDDFPLPPTPQPAPDTE